MIVTISMVRTGFAQYLILTQGEPGWQSVLKEWQIRTALLPTDRRWPTCFAKFRRIGGWLTKTRLRWCLRGARVSRVEVSSYRANNSLSDRPPDEIDLQPSQKIFANYRLDQSYSSSI